MQSSQLFKVYHLLKAQMTVDVVAEVVVDLSAAPNNSPSENAHDPLPHPIGTSPSLPDAASTPPLDLAMATETPEQAHSRQQRLDKQEWVKDMRLMFSKRPDYERTQMMVNEDGTLNQE
jgi:hypothetical protein